MGGKTKQAQRTKNNARPSSSGRSAELLGSLGAGGAGLAGAALFPSLAAAAPDAALAPDLALCIKKLNKKDPITKTKALQELKELVPNSKVEDVAAMLPNWTYLYKNLTVDTDRRVRELTQVCHGAVVAACGRRVAPQLRALLPSWLAAQHDEHAPARSAARRALHSTFPDSKLAEAISFCKAEVVSHIVDSLLDANAAISRKLENDEERQSAVTRVLVGALGGLRYVTHTLPEAHSEWLWEELAELLKANSFWKLAGHAASEVRCAWYGAVGALGARGGARWGAAHGARALRLLLSAREAGAPAAAHAAALLHVLQADTEWYSRLDKKELLPKRILEWVRAGGAGPLLPQLLPALPPAALPADFCAELVDACFAGLEKRPVQVSKIERASCATSIALCVRALAARSDLPADAARGALSAWLRAALRSDASAQTALVHAMYPVLAEWARTPSLELLLRAFWQGVASGVAARLPELCGADQSQLRATLDGHAHFLLALHGAMHAKPKKPKAVKFADELDPLASEEPTAAPTDTDQSDTAASELLQHQLSECSERVCAAYIEVARGSGQAQCVLRGLGRLLRDAGGARLWSALATALQGRPASAFVFWQLALLPWLSKEQTRCAEVVEVTFLLLPHLSEEEQTAVFHEFDKLDTISLVSDWVLPLAVGSDLPAAAGWVRAGGARAAVLRAARRALAGDGAATGTLLACLAPRQDGEVPAGEETASEVVQLVSYVVQHAGSGGGGAGACVGVAAKLLELKAGGTPHLLEALFTHELTHMESCSPRAVSWREGVAGAPPPQRAALVRRLAARVSEHLPTQCEELEFGRTIHCASLAAALAACGEVEAVTEILLASDSGAAQAVAAHALRYDIVEGRLSCPFDDSALVIAAASDSSEFSLEEFVRFARWCVLRAALARALARAAPRAPLHSAALLDVYVDLLRDQAVMTSIYDGYAFITPGFDKIESAEEQLSAIIREVKVLSPPDVLSAVGAAVGARAAAGGLYWARAAAAHGAAGGAPANAPAPAPATTGDGFFHTLQAESAVSPPPAPRATSARLRAAHAVMCRALHAAHAHADRALAGLGAHAPGEPTADVLVDAYYRREQTMLLDTDISSAAWREAACAAAAAGYLAALVGERGWELPAHHWDFVNICLASLLASVDQAKHAWGDTKVAMVTCAVLRLLSVVSEFVSDVPSEAVKRQPAEHVAALPREWADVFAPTIAHHLYSLLLHILECAAAEGGPRVSLGRARVLGALCRAVGRVPWRAQPAASRAQHTLQRALRAACGALARRTHHAYKYLAHYTLRALSEDTVLRDAEVLREWSGTGEGEEAQGEAPPLALHEVDTALQPLQDAVDAALQDFKVGEQTCEVIPGSETHSLALGWLLLVEALGSLASLQRGELALHHAELQRGRRYTELLLPAALRLLPAHVANYAMDPSNNAAAPRATALFREVKEFSVDEPSSSSDVSSLACRALYLSLSGAGAGAARGWWGAAGGGAARALGRLARAFVSPHLIKEQLKAVAERKPNDLPDSEVAVHWSSGEVTCCVYVEERRVELSVRLSDQHPLVLPRVTAPPPHPHSPAPNTHWLAVYLAYQNGSLLNALRMWASAVTARVEAAPQCYICYCRLHPGSGRLPSVPCHQCRNKFHPHCLRKWFTSSNKSNCPLCRAAF